jgi:hypoxanthine-guanine phosphoribosyltransferase
MATGSATKKVTYQVLDDLTVHIECMNNPYHFELSHLFQMATRINKKRSFLFVSKVLGKHLAVDPKICLLTGHLLAMRYMEVVHGKTDSRIQDVAKAIQTKQNVSEMLRSINEKPIVQPQSVTCIGFAETATALGHAVFSSFKDRAKYIHTTREQIQEMESVIHFEEEHSHATSHRVYAMDQDFFMDDMEVLLIDDEITTGKTAVNIVRKMKEVYPFKKTFTVISILDWRSQENRDQYRQLEQELGITIHAVSLLEGSIEVEGTTSLTEESTRSKSQFHQKIIYQTVRAELPDQSFFHVASISNDGVTNHSPYLKATGRFGITKQEESDYAAIFKSIGEKLQRERTGNRTLVIGTGEFMYIPMKVASYMGDGVYFQSTTRSPIYQTTNDEYLIRQKFTFDSPENKGITNYLYNLDVTQYDEVFILLERTADSNATNSLLAELRRTQIPTIHVLTMT